MNKIKFLFAALAVVFTTSVIAQTTVTGTIMNAELNAPLLGANIVVKGTTKGAIADFDGNFTLTTDVASGEVVISYIGYISQTLPFSGDTDLGNIILKSSEVGLDEIMITASVAVDRKTPVAVSTIKAQDIALKLSTQEFPEILKSTPGVYATRAGGGYGDGRVNLRGFDSNNTWRYIFRFGALPINTLPVHDYNALSRTNSDHRHGENA